MRKTVVMLSLFLAASIAIPESGRTAEKLAPSGFGQTYNEIVALAKKEGKVRVSTSDPDEKDAPRFFRPFEQKYGITVEYIRSIMTESRERVLLEIMAGTVEYDTLHISEELITDYKKAGVVAGPFDWQALFGIKPVFIDPEKYIVAAGSSAFGIIYNPDLVPKERVPRSWEDFLDPYWKRKFVVDVRPMTFFTLYPAWGKKKLLDYCRALVANGPIWKSGQTQVIAQVAAGEYPVFCGTLVSSGLRLLERDPTVRIAISIPKELPAKQYATLGVLKSAKYPNAALLLAGWLASAEGDKQYDKIIHRGSPLLEDTETGRLVKEAGAKVLYAGWDFTPAQQAEVTKWIMEAWGFPVGKN
jgi:iron(III) transport system substrate-binding protein